MSCFPFSCSKKKKPEKSREQIIQELEDTGGSLIAEQQNLERQIEECGVAAKNFATTNKRMAMHTLQRKKRLEKDLWRMDRTITTLELQKEALRNAKVNAAILGPMQVAAEFLKGAKKSDNIKVPAVAGQNISFTFRYSDSDEEEPARELEELEEAMAKESSAGPSGLTKCPSVPEELNPKTTKTGEIKKNRIIASL